jgi:hypothetical protein
MYRTPNRMAAGPEGAEDYQRDPSQVNGQSEARSQDHTSFDPASILPRLPESDARCLDWREARAVL